LNVLVTGGTGFLGSRLIPLLLQRGDNVIALARSASSRAALESAGVDAVIDASLTDGPALVEALKGVQVDVAVHLAAEIASQRSKAKLRSVNIDGTWNLYAALRNHTELKKFIFASTVVTGEANGELLVEDKPLHVETEYGRTKQAGERILLGAFKTDGFPALVIRPCHIYGPGGWFADVLRDTKRGKMRVPGNGKNSWDMVHVDDCARAFVVAMEKGQPGQIYHCADDTPTTMGAVVAESARLLNIKQPGSVPRFLANWVLGRDTVTSVMRSGRTSNTKLRGLGWEPAYPDSKIGLRDTVAALKL